MKESLPKFSQWKYNISEIIQPFPQKGKPQETYAKFYLNDLWFDPPYSGNGIGDPEPNGRGIDRHLTSGSDNIIDISLSETRQNTFNSASTQYHTFYNDLARRNITNVYHCLAEQPDKWLVLSRYTAFTGQSLSDMLAVHLAEAEDNRYPIYDRPMRSDSHLPFKIIEHFLSGLYKKAVSEDNFLEYLDSVPFQFSLCNSASIQLDSVLAQNEILDIIKTEYRPYLYEFQGQILSSSQPYTGLSRFSVISLIEMVTGTTTALSCQLFHHSDLTLMTQTLQNSNDLIAVLDGTVTFSASPISDESAYLAIYKRKIRKDALNEKEQALFDAVLDDSIYKCSRTFSATSAASKTVHHAIANALSLTSKTGSPSKEKPTAAVIHNVGQGNNILIELDNGRKFFYDIGMTLDKDERNDPAIQEAIKQFSRVSPNMVVLSHWDLDHILGISYANDAIYDALWVVPDLWALCRYRSKKKTYRFVSDFAKRLYKFLDCLNNGRLIIIDSTWKQAKIFPDQDSIPASPGSSEPNRGDEAIQIWSGTCQYASGKDAAGQAYTITPANNWALILSLKNIVSMLLPGDCEYKKMPAAVRDLYKYEFFIAPHHCSKMSAPKISPGPKISAAAFPCGQNAYLLFGTGPHSARKYHHPDRVHKYELQKRFNIVDVNGIDVIRCPL